MSERRYIKLHGSARDRRKQLRALRRQHPDTTITLHGDVHRRMIGGKWVEYEDANTVQTIVRLTEG